MIRYRAGMDYCEQTIGKLAEMQHKTFCAKERVVMASLAVFFLVFGVLLGMRSVTGILCCFAGCVLLTGINSRPRATAKELIAQANGNYPTMQYTFRDTGFSSQYEEEETPYASIIKLVDEGTHLFLYVDMNKAYMIDSDTIRNKQEFLNFISSKSKQDWTKPLSIFNLSIKTFKDFI